MDERAKLSAKDTAAVQEFVHQVRAVLENKVVEVKLFGSKATGKDQPDSDIDVLVVVDRLGLEVEDAIVDIAFDINLKHDVYISPRVIDRSILVDPVWSITPFLQAIAKEGIRL